MDKFVSILQADILYETTPVQTELLFKLRPELFTYLSATTYPAISSSYYLSSTYPLPIQKYPVFEISFIPTPQESLQWRQTHFLSISVTHAIKVTLSIWTSKSSFGARPIVVLARCWWRFGAPNQKQEKLHKSVIKGFCRFFLFPCRHFPYSRDFVISPVYRHLPSWKQLAQLKKLMQQLSYDEAYPWFIFKSIELSAGPMCLTHYFTLVSCQTELININVWRSSFGILIGSRPTGTPEYQSIFDLFQRGR